MSYVKNYEIGNIRLDSPCNHFIYELPLLSFGDVQHAIALSLVFNSRLANENLFCMGCGYKLNMQKRLIMENGVPVSYEDGYGKLTSLNNEDNRYSFDDDTQRFIGAAGNDFRLDNPDYSCEIYDNYGRIKFVADKYGVFYLRFTYDIYGRLSSISFRGNKKISINYDSGNALSSITYLNNEANICTTNITYSGGINLIVNHYSGVKYHLSYSGTRFIAYSTDGDDTYSTYSHRLDCIRTNTKITIQSKIGNKITNGIIYDFLKLTSENKILLMDVTDFYGNKTRVQFNGDYPCYSYEISDSMFSPDDNTPNHTYLGSVNFHIKNQISGTESYTDGVKMTYFVDEYSTGFDRFRYYQNASEAIMLSGWLKSVDNVSECNIMFYNGETLVNSTPVNILTENSWMYFSVGIPNYDFNNMSISIGISKERVQMADFRLIYNEGNNHTTTEETVFIFNSAEIYPIDDETEFYFCTEEEATAAMESGNYSSLNRIDLEGHYITANDIVRYQINEIKGNYTNEAYIDNCRLIRINAKPLMVKLGNNLWDVTAVSVGKRYKRGNRTYLTRNNVLDGDILLTTASYIDGTQISRQEFSKDFDIVSSTTDGLGTMFQYALDEYGRGTGLVTRKTVGAISTTASYDLDNFKLLSTTDEFGVMTTYTTDLTWGVITATSCGDTSVSNEFDGDKSTIQEREFSGTDGTRLYEFEYTNGNLSLLTNGALGYEFGYSFGSLASVSKCEAQVEQHILASNNTILKSFYPSQDNALYSIISHTDSYGRLTEVDDILKNTYDVNPIKSNGEYTVMADENNAGVNYSNGSAKLASSTDLTTEETTKYAYINDQISSIGVFNSSETKISEESFEYDSLGRLTKNTYSFGSTTVGNNFTYLLDENAYNADERIGSTSYLVNGVSKATATNYFDTYKKIKRKLISIGNTYDRNITYNQTRVTRVMDVKNGSTINNVSYSYDSMGRITSEADSINTNVNTTYVYDSFGQLIRENNKALDKTFIYCYDNIGNITSVKTYAYTTAETPSVTYTTYTYTYDPTQKDRLTQYGYNNISYNSIGYPLSYGDKAFVWTNGKLTRLYDDIDENSSSSSEDIRFTYNAHGQRIAKSYVYDPGPDYSGNLTIGIDTTYDYDQSGRLIREFSTEYFTESASLDREFIYLYDENGMVGVLYSYNGSTPVPYYYHRNLQGDVIAIYDTSGNAKAKYAYDAWGNCKVTNSSLHDLAYNNPIRYRGYYYDRETKLYYLNARYYNPQWRRFISPDSTEYLDPDVPNGLNLYAYCGNDPVNRFDPTGHDWEWSTFWTGLFMVGTAITAIALSVTTFGAGIPLAMSIVAGVTLGAGVLTGINGVATMIESGTDYNFVRDGLFNDVLGLSDSAYNVYAGITEGVAAVGSMILGFYHTTGQYKAAKASQQYLGKGYTKAGKNRWVSADGYRQVRWDTTHHMYKGKPSPVHFNWYEYQNPIAPGVRNKLVSDVHVWLKWFSYYM